MIVKTDQREVDSALIGGAWVLVVFLLNTPWAGPFIRDVTSLQVLKGVVAWLLTAMLLLAFLGLRYPVRILLILLFRGDLEGPPDRGGRGTPSGWPTTSTMQ